MNQLRNRAGILQTDLKTAASSQIAAWQAPHSRKRLVPH